MPLDKVSAQAQATGDYLLQHLSASAQVVIDHLAKAAHDVFKETFQDLSNSLKSAFDRARALVMDNEGVVKQRIDI